MRPEILIWYETVYLTATWTALRLLLSVSQIKIAFWCSHMYRTDIQIEILSKPLITEVHAFTLAVCNSVLAGGVLKGNEWKYTSATILYVNKDRLQTSLW